MMPASPDRALSGRFILGVDGCPAGWFAARASLDHHGRINPNERQEWSIFQDFQSLLQSPFSHNASAIAVDVPIGVSDNGDRGCDALARRALPGKASSVFNCPCRAALSATSHADANTLNRHFAGKGLSIQSWHITGKIREVDQCMTPTRQRQVIEGHPEVVFARLNDGAPIRSKKSEPGGREDRFAVLEHSGLADVRRWHHDIIARTARKDLRRDDIIDAAAMLFCAEGFLLGTPPALSTGARDSKGLLMAIFQ